MVMGVIGFTYGMFSADSKIAEEKVQAHVRYQKETDKDRALESAIEQEIERQRALENQIAGVTGQRDQHPTGAPTPPGESTGTNPAQSPAGSVEIIRLRLSRLPAPAPHRRRRPFAMSKSAI